MPEGTVYDTVYSFDMANLALCILYFLQSVELFDLN